MRYQSSPMYTLADDHRIGLLAFLLVPLVFWLLRRDKSRGTFSRAYDTLPGEERALIWALSIDGALHILLAGHRPEFAVFGLAEVFLVWRALKGATVRIRSGLLSAVGLLVFALQSLGGTAPDQLALISKLLEVSILVLALAGWASTWRRRWVQSALTTGLALVVATAGWAGAMQAGGHGHEPGEIPGPGVLLPVGSGGEATPELAEAARRLHLQVSEAIAPYADIEVASAAGYSVAGLAGTSFHAENPAFKKDGRFLDPDAPETLVYAAGPNGPVLLGAMFEMDRIGEPGQAVGGPLTPWHAHDHVCFSLLPPGLAGLTGPFGSCPIATITIPVTPEMIHVWTVPGAPDPFGDLDDAWLDAYLSR
jgi:hypothetical protein